MNISLINKKCRKCNTDKPINEFSIFNRSPDGLQSWCKECVNINQREYYIKNRVEIKLKLKKYQQDNPNILKKANKKYYIKNKDKIKKHIAAWNSKPENIIKRRLAKREWDRKAMLNPLHRISNNMRGNLYNALKAKKSSRTWESLVGYTIQDLINRIEPLLVNTTMTWDNYGEVWHVDHIIPKSWFKYVSTDDSTFKECWALSNLQPKLKLDNIRKGNRYIG